MDMLTTKNESLLTFAIMTDYISGMSSNYDTTDACPEVRDGKDKQYSKDREAQPITEASCLL